MDAWAPCRGIGGLFSFAPDLLDHLEGLWLMTFLYMQTCLQVCTGSSRPSLFSCLTDFLCLSNSSFSLPWQPKPTKQLGSLDDVFFHSPESQEAVQILSVSSKAQSRAGLALQRLHCNAFLRPWWQNNIMQNVGCIMLMCCDLFCPSAALWREWKYIDYLDRGLCSQLLTDS